MWNSELAKARVKAAELSQAWMAANKSAEAAATSDEKIKLYNAAKDVALKLTEANAEVARLGDMQRETDAATQLAKNYLDPAPDANPGRLHPDAGLSGDAEPDARLAKKYRAAHTDAAVAFIRSGGDIGAAREILTSRQIPPQVQATMIAGNLRTGGMLLPPEWLQPRDDRAQPPVMRELCEVVTTSSESIVVPLIDGALETDNMTAEGYEHPVADRQDVTTGGVEIKVNDWHPKPVVVSQKLLRASGTNIDQIIGGRVMRRKNLDEDLQFLFGTGSGEAYGLMRESSVAQIATQHASELTWAGLINLVFDDVNGLGEEWSNGTSVLMRRATFGTILGTPDPAGNYVFRLAEAISERSLLGEPVRFSPHMAAVAADAYPIVRGWFPAYTIVDHTSGLTIKRLEEKYDPNVGFSVLGLFGGRCVQPAAFVKLKVALTV